MKTIFAFSLLVVSINAALNQANPRRGDARAPREVVETKFDEPGFYGKVTYKTTPGKSAVWLDNLEGLVNVDCSDSTQIVLSFEKNSQTALPEVWGSFPLNVIISSKYTNCLEKNSRVSSEIELGAKTITGTKDVKENTLILSVKPISFRKQLVQETQFEIYSKAVGSDAKLIDIGGNIPFFKDFSGMPLIDHSQLPGSVICSTCSLRYDLGWKIYGSLNLQGAKYGVTFTGTGKANFDLNYSLPKTYEFDSGVKTLFSYPIGTNVDIPGIVTAGFFVKLEGRLKVNTNGDVSITAGFDLVQREFTYNYDSQTQSSFSGGEIVPNSHPVDVKLEADISPSVHLNPVLEAKLKIFTKDLNIGLGLDNHFASNMHVSNSGICALDFKLDYTPSIFYRLNSIDNILKSFNTMVVVPKVCLKGQ
ncbi:hypothetical protein HK099_001795 [Clydaea vesicula]|uniref:Uncharacterized protein n=1 Tax=Clydaea vesicula TaxID=447962 RepID=A0AAD5Y132_9FUNG|nr:hypothetical protein HK099_001795 [Clydaea vesicula]